MHPGVSVDGPDVDLAGNERICGDAIDLGAFETCLEAFTPYRRGDANADGDVNVSDAVATILWVFFDAFQLSCESAADVDDGGSINSSDAIVTLRYLFQAGPAFPAPGADLCGTDPTGDELSCDSFAPCPVE